jgi:hypothetical protein
VNSFTQQKGRAISAALVFSGWWLVQPEFSASREHR